MAAQFGFSDCFLADLEIAYPKDADSKLPITFVDDLNNAYAYALPNQPVISLVDLENLAEALGTWRMSQRQLLQEYRNQLPEDDPLASPISLFGTMDYGRLETAHTRALAWL
jgi:hypothetical protein